MPTYQSLLDLINKHFRLQNLTINFNKNSKIDPSKIFEIVLKILYF